MSTHVINEKTWPGVRDLLERTPRDGTMEIVLRKRTDPRTREQNAYFHLLCRRISGETRVPIESCKTYLVMKFIGPTSWLTIDGKDVPVLPSTTSLDKHEMSTLIEHAEAFAVEQGVDL